MRKTYNDFYELVKECHDEVMRDLSDTFENEEPTRPNTSEIIWDYLSLAAEEFTDMSLEDVEETFNSIYEAIDKETLKDAMAWA